LIWFGAGVSLAEILTGTAYASMPLGKGSPRSCWDTLIGGILIVSGGPYRRQNQKERHGDGQAELRNPGRFVFLRALNIAQMAGWTAIMIYDGSLARMGYFMPADGSGAWSSACSSRSGSSSESRA
jgi:purine-cytosine permease-like protein